MNKIIIEKIESCIFVHTAYKSNGHGAFGEPDYTSYKYVILSDGAQVEVYDSMYILHDNHTVLDTGLICLLEPKMQKYLDLEYSKKLKDKRYGEYLKLKNEFENDPIYIRDQNILRIIND